MGEHLAGGTAVVTGAAGGIGLGIARAAAAAGMKVVMADIVADKLAEVADDMAGQGHDVLAVPTDVTDPAALDRLARMATEHFGSVRLLVNNAGIEAVGRMWELSAEQWRRTIGINVLGPVNGVRAFAPAMIADGGPAFIANVASIGGLAMAGNQAAYLSSKHAVLSLSECLFLEMQAAAPHIHVSCVLPGPVQTRIFTDAPVGGDPEAAAKFVAHMDTVLASEGVTGDDAGQMIFDQIVEGRFWVTTHPDMLVRAAKARADHLAELTLPAAR